jgi:hypothetical protein
MASARVASEATRRSPARRTRRGWRGGGAAIAAEEEGGFGVELRSDGGGGVASFTARGWGWGESSGTWKLCWLGSGPT